MLVFLCRAVERNAVGDEPRRHRRVARVHGAEGPEQERAVAAELRAGGLPAVAQAPDLLGDRRIHALAGIAAADVHRHHPAQFAVASMELRHQRPRPRPRQRIGRPHARRRMQFMQPLEDRAAVEGGEPRPRHTLPQHRHQARRRQRGDVALPVLGIELEQPLRKRNPQLAHRQPRPQRPRRVVLVGDHQRQRHLFSMRGAS